tara:strand:+ start:324 stop:488 length:165 start_codon:yes stop_codon:yes gene_type:complete
VKDGALWDLQARNSFEGDMKQNNFMYYAKSLEFEDPEWRHDDHYKMENSRRQDK